MFIAANIAGAITQQEMQEARSLIESGASCGDLSESQLELIGEYEMERIHPGAAHEAMHRMMGLEEGTAAEGRFHINLAKRVYCREGNGMMGGMMGNLIWNNTYLLVPR